MVEEECEERWAYLFEVGAALARADKGLSGRIELEGDGVSVESQRADDGRRRTAPHFATAQRPVHSRWPGAILRWRCAP
jgi:hypothetical protein